MLKSWLITFVVLFLLVVAYKINLFAFFASSGFRIAAFVMVGAALTAAVIVLGNPLKGLAKRTDEDEHDFKQK